MPTHVYALNRLLPAQKLGVFTRAAEAQGDTRHEAEKLNPSEKYFPAVGLLPFSWILPYKLPRPALPHACSSRTRSQELRLWAHRACDAWHQPTPSWVRRGGCRIADMGVD